MLLSLYTGTSIFSRWHSTVDEYTHKAVQKRFVIHIGNIKRQTYYLPAEDGQNSRLVLVTVGTLPASEPGNFTYAPRESDATVWGVAGVPMDGTPQFVTNPPLLPLVVLMYTYATAGIVFALVCMVFNIVFRKKKSVSALFILCANAVEP